MGLLEATSGQVSINGAPMKGPGTDRGIVFQQKSLFPWLTARKNVAFGIEQANPKISRKERFQIADEFLDKVGLSGYEQTHPMALSGGQRDTHWIDAGGGYISYEAGAASFDSGCENPACRKT